MNMFDWRKVSLALVAVALILIGAHGTTMFWEIYHAPGSLITQATHILALGLFVLSLPIIIGIGYILLYLCRTTENEVAYEAELDRALRDLDGGGPPNLN